MFRELSARHPGRNELEGGGGNAQEGDDVWMRQMFPNNGLPTEGLHVSSEGTETGGDTVDTHAWPAPDLRLSSSATV